jgi:hypothetical protein
MLFIRPRPGSAGIAVSNSSSSRLRWGRRVGFIVFLFFLIKGLAWLLVPAAIAAFVAL